MADHAIQFKGWQMGTWFVVDESQIIQQLKLMLETSTGTKVKVRLDRNGLKLTKMTTIPMMGSEKKIPLTRIKSIFTDPKFPLCFFCTTTGPNGYLLKIIIIRCDQQMFATGIVNYYRTLTYKRPSTSGPSREGKTATPEKVPANGQTAKDQIANQTNGNVKDVEKIMPFAKVTEAGEVTKSENAKENEIETTNDIKKLSEEVNAIEQQTLKKHRATISRQEYIDAHEKVNRFATEVTKQNAHITDKDGRRYTLVTAQSRNPKFPVNAYQSRHNGYYIVNNNATPIPAVRKRSKTVNARSSIFANNQRREPSNFILNSNTENGEARSTPQRKANTSEATADQTGEVNVPIPNKMNATATESQEPIYAQVMKNRVVADPPNEEANSHPIDDAPTTAQVDDMPLVPPRTVTFQNWSAQVQNEATIKTPVARVRPHSFHQGAPQLITTYVSKPIEKVYNNSSRRIPTWKQYERHRPRVNSNTFVDGKQRLVLHKGTIQI